MLYTFSNLSARITELGYPESTYRGFRVIKRDLTKEEQAGNLEFRVDGIYLNVDGNEYKGYMYLKFPDIQAYGMPKFHITNCKTILNQRNTGGFDGRYFWHNSNNVDLEDRATGNMFNDVNLTLCGNCARQSNIANYSDTAGFFDLLDRQEEENVEDQYEVDIFGYVKDWQKISRAFKQEKEYTCESCTIVVSRPMDKRFIHAHHINGNKLNNKRSNLECLCVLCHSFKDATHIHNFDKRRMQADVKAFVEKYFVELSNVQNPFLSRVQ